MNDICMTVLTDGRKEYIRKALPTWIDAYGDQIEKKFIIDDSGSPRYRKWLARKFPSFIIVPVAEDRSGYSEAMRKVFSVIVESEAEYCLHIEDDFVLLKPFVLEDVVKVLSQFNRLSQISFMRQPWYTNEIESGGVVEALEANGGAFTQRATAGRSWVVHRAFWTCNPSIFPAWVAARWWPDPPWCEMYFGKLLKEDEKVFGIWGDRKSPDWILTEHIGRKRNGTNY
jgi:hypothetical protein